MRGHATVRRRSRRRFGGSAPACDVAPGRAGCLRCPIPTGLSGCRSRWASRWTRAPGRCASASSPWPTGSGAVPSSWRWAVRRFLPLGAFVALAAVLGAGLTRKPREVPSPFIGKPAPPFMPPLMPAVPDHLSAAAAAQGAACTQCGAAAAPPGDCPIDPQEMGDRPEGIPDPPTGPAPGGDKQAALRRSFLFLARFRAPLRTGLSPAGYRACAGLA